MFQENDDDIDDFIRCAHDFFLGPPEVQQQASDFFYQKIHHPKAFLIGLNILKRYDDLYSRYSALTIFNIAISKNWTMIDSKSREETRYLLYNVLQNESNPTIINFCSMLISKIAINEYPENWSEFLIDSLTSGNSLILINYLEALDNDNNIPKSRKMLIHQLFISSFEFIQSAIFDNPTISSNAIHLYSLISYWAPLNKIINVRVITLLTTGLIENFGTRKNAIECLDVIFVKRCDCKDEFSNIYLLLLTNLYESSKKYAECAILMANILCSHLDFFKKANEIINISYLPPKTEDFDEYGNPLLNIMIGNPKGKAIKETVKKYSFYESCKDFFLLFIQPGWCLKKNISFNNVQMIRNQFGENPYANDGNYCEDPIDDNVVMNSSDQCCDDELDDDDDDELIGPDLYWHVWNKFLNFALSLECPLNENPILSNIPQLFNSMYSFVLNALKRDSMINPDAQSCFAQMMRVNPKFIISQLESKGLSVNLLCTTCCCIEEIDFDYANNFIQRFYVENNNPLTVSQIILCVSYLLRLIPRNESLFNFFMNLLMFSIHFKPVNRELQYSVAASLLYLSSNFTEIFYFNDFALLNMVVSFISSINIGPEICDPVNRTLFFIAARVIIEIFDKNLYIEYIKNVTKNIRHFLESTYSTIFQQNNFIYLSFYHSINLMNEFCKRCFKLVQVEGRELIKICMFVIDYKCHVERDVDLVSSCYDLCKSLITSYSTWSLAEPSFFGILKVALSGNADHFGFALKFLSGVHLIFKESIQASFQDVYDKIIQPLMINVSDNSKYVLEYLYSAKYWIFPFDIPIEFMRVVIQRFPFDCAKPTLKIISEYCNNHELPHIQVFLNEMGEDLFRFLIQILIDSTFNIYFLDIVKAFMSFFNAICGFNMTNEVMVSMISVLDGLFPNLSLSQTFDNESNSDFARKERMDFFLDFIISCKYCYFDQQSMKNILRNFVISTNCCLPTVSNIFSEIRESSERKKKMEEKFFARIEKESKRIKKEMKFKEINDDFFRDDDEIKKKEEEEEENLENPVELMEEEVNDELVIEKLFEDIDDDDFD